MNEIRRARTDSPSKIPDGQRLNELRRSSASGSHGKSGKSQTRFDRREMKKALKRGEEN